MTDGSVSLDDVLAAVVMAAKVFRYRTQRWLKISEAAEYSRLSPKSIQRMLEAGKLHAHRPVSGRILVDRQELDALIAASAS